MDSTLYSSTCSRSNLVWVCPGGLDPKNNGVVPALLQLLLEIAKYHRVTALTFDAPQSESDYNLDQVRVLSCYRKTRVGVVTEVWRRLSDLHRTTPIAMVHGLFGIKAAALAVGWARAHQLPSMVSFFGGEPVSFPEIGYGGWGSPMSREALRYAVSRASIRTASSSFLIDCFRRIGFDGVWNRFSFGVLQAPFCKQRLERRVVLDAPPTLLCIADLRPVKGHAVLLEALRILLQNRNVRLWLAGESVQPDAVHSWINAYGLQQSVTVLGRVPHEQLPTLLARADLLVHAARHEGQGVVFLEAAAAGCPIVGTEVGLLPEMADRGAALAVPVNQPVALARQIETLLDDEVGRIPQAKCAAIYAQQFDLPRVCEHLRELYALALEPPNELNGARPLA